MMKKFVAYWSQDNWNNDIAEIHTLDFFNENLGYELDDIQKINNLEIGQSWHTSGFASDDHYILRVE